MTDKMISSNEQRAQIFALLRTNASDEEEDRVRPNYLDDSVADMMIGRAISSFQAPTAMPECIANQQTSGTSSAPMRLTGQPTEQFAS